jgi:bromodomain-containing protein 7/9
LGGDDDVDVNVDADDDASAGRGTPLGSVSRGTPVDGEQSPIIGTGRKDPWARAAAKKAEPMPPKEVKEPTMKAELDAEGHLPGFRDGVGQFPPDSEWARIMVELKLKGSTSYFLPLNCL